MPDMLDPQSVIAEAEQAAVNGDYASAERLLGEAAALQEASLGPHHPELANTLNNLGVVYEVTEKPDEAERCFRRAYEIATAVLPPDHSFVATSRKNLEDFLAARTQATTPPVPPPVPSPVPPPVPLPIAPPIPLPAGPQVRGPEHHEHSATAPQRSTEDHPPVAAPTSTRSLAIGAVLAGVLLVALVASGPWFRRDRAPEPAPADVGATSVSPSERATAGSAKRADPAPVTEPERAAGKSEAPAKERTKSATISTPPLVVVEAQLCRDLQGARPASGGWKCSPPDQPVTAGRLLFYSRIKSPRDTSVEHRWSRDGRLSKSASLTIRANPGTGYRTYSRNTVGAGDWRVELRTRDGAVLHEERFSVR